MKPLRILALDCSFTTGWATSLDGEVASGVIQFKSSEKTHPALRYARFGDWLRRVRIRGQSLDCIGYEKPHFQGYHATMALCGLNTRVEEIAAVSGIPCFSFRAQAIKSHATGKGNATKDKMQEAAALLYPHYDPDLDPGADEADALMMLDYMLKNVEL